MIDFYLRALRICSPQFLIEEFGYIETSFKSLKYPKFFILNARKKALKIHSPNKRKKTNPTIPITHRPVSLPTSTHNTLRQTNQVKNTHRTNHVTNHLKPCKLYKMDQPQNHFPRGYILYLMLRVQQILHRRNPMQSREKYLRTQAIDKNKWRSKRPFLPHVRPQTHIRFFQSHRNLTNNLQKHAEDY